MKNRLIFLLIIPIIGSAQISDGFEDGNFSVNPSWKGDSLSFKVNSDHRLQLNASGSDTAYLSTPTEWLSENEWQFWIRLGFNTSSNNNARVYLAAKGSGQEYNPDGYYIQIGGSADSIDLLKKSGQQLHHLYRFRTFSTAHSNNIMRFRVTRSEGGLWHTYIDTTGGTGFIPDGSFLDSGVMDSCRFGLWCRFTSSNATRIYFDDFYCGPVIIDTQPPVVELLEIVDSDELFIRFSEVPERTSVLDKNHYRLLGLNQSPDTVVLDDDNPLAVRLHFSGTLQTGAYDTLFVSGLKDYALNIMHDTLLPVCFYLARPFDIVIHEIMADPEPESGVPAGEFIELYNRTQFPIVLKNWWLGYGSTMKLFPSGIIQPKEFLIVAKDSAYLEYGPGILLFSSSTSLSNDGTTITLMDKEKHIIHSVSYSPDWYRGTFKEEGGWSLEMMDPFNPCGCGENWAGSTDQTGATPGRPNSVAKSNPDESPPFLMRAAIVDSAELKVYFSEPMDSLTLFDVFDWRYDDLILEMVPEGPDFRTVRLKVSDVFMQGKIYSLTTGSGPEDCAGNGLDTTRCVRFALPDSVIGNDIVVNEILPNPVSGGSRFIELYNRSEKVLDLVDLLVSPADTIIGLLPEGRSLTDESMLIFPGSYLVFTDDPDDIRQRFHVPWPERVERMTGFPVLDEDTGVVLLARKDNFSVIDRVIYAAGMHHPFLVTEEGVSLERLDPDRSSSAFSNWHSAASTVGFATPGYQNSQNSPETEAENILEVFPQVFSPDNDGIDDYLVIKLHPERPDYIVKVEIYDAKGRKTICLTDNDLLSTEATFIWDGTTEDHSVARLGVYIVFVEMIHPDGNSERFKKAVVVAGKF
jgi:hypothetical protein